MSSVKPALRATSRPIAQQSATYGEYRIAILNDTVPRGGDNSYMQDMRSKIATQIATLFGIGNLPKAPGTWATLASLPVVFLLLHLNPVAYMVVTFLLLIIGIIACDILNRHRNSHDDGDLVIDELVGILITMTWLPITWQSFVLGFILFRLLDILKPFPINLLDKRIKGGLGVMLDDVAAGMIASVILQLVYSKTNWLGSQLVILE